MRQVDVVVLTKNSEHLLERCLKSVFQNVPVNKLIVVDGYSTDHTPEIVEKFSKRHGNVEFVQMEGSRAKARTEGIRRVSTEWFMFVDSDALLCSDWFKKVQADLAEDVGAVWGLNVDVLPNLRDKRILRMQGLVAQQCFHLRGGMHDTLMRRKAVEGIVIPEELHVFEDAYIIRWVETHGYRAIVGGNVYCLHYNPPDKWNLQNGISQAIVEFKCGLVYSHMFKYAIFYPVFFLYWSLQLPLNGYRNGSKH